MPLIAAGNTNTGLSPHTILDRTQTKVFAKQRWGDEWAETPLIALNASTKAFPGRSTCTLQIDTGQVKRPADSDYEFHDEQHDDEDLWVDHFVCVVVFPPDKDDGTTVTPYAVWCGYLPQQSVDVGGDQSAVDAQGNPTLEFETSITITAYGLDYLLERRQIRGAFILGDQDHAKQILRAPAFNERTRGGTGVLGNSSGKPFVENPPPPEGQTPADVWVFDGEQVVWDTRRIIDYLLYFSQKTIDKDDSPHFILSAEELLVDFLGSIEPIIRQERQNVRALLVKLIERKRGLGAAVRWASEDENDMLLPKGDVDIFVYSLSHEMVLVGDSLLPDNPIKANLAFGRDLGVTPTVKLDSLATYDEIILEGERIRSVFTVGGSSVVGDKYNLIEGVWTGQNAYFKADDEQRKSDIHDQVFRLFALPIDYDWLQNGVDSNLAPTLDDDGNVDFLTGANQFNAYVKILPTLPMLERADSTAALAEPRFMRPFALLEVPNPDDPLDSEPTGKYVFADALPDEEIGLYSAGRVTPHDRGGMIEVRFSPNHILGLGTFFNPDGDPFGRCTPVGGGTPFMEKQSICLGQGAAWDNAQLGPCSFPPAQISEANCTALGGTWDNGTCTFPITQETQEDCATKGGDWLEVLLNHTPSDLGPVFDYRKMLVTIAVELDQYAAVRVVTGAPGNYGHKRRLTVHIPDAHVWVRGVHVVDGLNEDGSVHEMDGPRILRDDTQRLRAIGELAKLWYGTRRRTVDVVEHGIFTPIPIGTMIEKVAMESAQKDVNTVVSEQRWDFENGTTAIATGYSELDLSAF